MNSIPTYFSNEFSLSERRKERKVDKSHRRTMRFFILHSSYLTFDILLSLVCNLSFFGAIAHSKIPVPIYTFYVFSVLSLYLFDRILDSRISNSKELTSRDLFFQRNQNWIYFILSFSLLISGLTSLSLPIPLLVRLGTIGSLLLLFFFIKIIPREIFISVFYCVGILLPIYESEIPFWILGLFFLHIVSNVLLTYSCDIPWDERSKKNTIARQLGERTTKRTAQFFLCLGAFFCLFMGMFFSNSGVYLVATSSLFFSYLFLFSISLFSWDREIFKSLCELSYVPLGFPFLLNLFSSY